MLSLPQVFAAASLPAHILEVAARKYGDDPLCRQALTGQQALTRESAVVLAEFAAADYDAETLHDLLVRNLLQVDDFRDWFVDEDPYDLSDLIEAGVIPVDKFFPDWRDCLPEIKTSDDAFRLHGALVASRFAGFVPDELVRLVAKERAPGYQVAVLRDCVPVEVVEEVLVELDQGGHLRGDDQAWRWFETVLEERPDLSPSWKDRLQRLLDAVPAYAVGSMDHEALQDFILAGEDLREVGRAREELLIELLRGEFELPSREELRDEDQVIQMFDNLELWRQLPVEEKVAAYLADRGVDLLSVHRSELISADVLDLLAKTGRAFPFILHPAALLEAVAVTTRAAKRGDGHLACMAYAVHPQAGFQDRVHALHGAAVRDDTATEAEYVNAFAVFVRSDPGFEAWLEEHHAQLVGLPDEWVFNALR